MPRRARLDAAGVLHHVWARCVKRKSLFLDDRDREEFLSRLDKACELHGARIYAWCLMPNHFHLAIRTGDQPLGKTMRSVLTGYAMYFNRRRRREGHLFQNRYKSTIVDEERYFLALVRYIHLNPYRARLVDSVEGLAAYPWSGHSVLMGQSRCAFQDVDAVLSHFGKRAGTARRALLQFMKMDEAKSEMKTFEGGGLLRSAGGLENLRALRRGPKLVYDERILGGSSFVESVLKKAEKKNRRRLVSQRDKWKAFNGLLGRLCVQFDVKEAELLCGSKRRVVCDVRQLLSYAGYCLLNLSAAEMGRVLSVSGQGVLKSALRAEQTWDNLDCLMEGLVR